MISEEQYRALKESYGRVSSWAFWERPGSTPKSNVGVIPDFDDPRCWRDLGTGFVFVGLNASDTHKSGNEGKAGVCWGNFHSGYSRGNDFKLRYALMDTPYWGSYLTDAIKHHADVKSQRVMRFLKYNPDVERANMDELRRELAILGDVHTLVAMGNDAAAILKRNMSEEYNVVKIVHYSCTRHNKESYREKVLPVLEQARQNSLR